MKIYEYQAKELFRRYGIPVPGGVVVRSLAELRETVAHIVKGEGRMTKKY